MSRRLFENYQAGSYHVSIKAVYDIQGINPSTRNEKQRLSFSLPVLASVGVCVCVRGCVDVDAAMGQKNGTQSRCQKENYLVGDQWELDGTVDSLLMNEKGVEGR